MPRPLALVRISESKIKKNIKNVNMEWGLVGKGLRESGRRIRG